MNSGRGLTTPVGVRKSMSFVRSHQHVTTARRETPITTGMGIRTLGQDPPGAVGFQAREEISAEM